VNELEIYTTTRISSSLFSSSPHFDKLLFQHQWNDKLYGYQIHCKDTMKSIEQNKPIICMNVVNSVWIKIRKKRFKLN